MAVNTRPPPPPLASPPPSSRVSSGTIERVVQALFKWKDPNSKTQKASLLEPNGFVYLTLKKILANACTNPFKIPLPHPLIDLATAEICLIIDNQPKSDLTKEAAQKKIKSEGIPVAKVLKLPKLRTKYRPFEAKRKLCDSCWTYC